MKIAITATGRTLDAHVDPRFGRAKYFIVYDTKDGSFSVLENQQNMNSPRGAGVQAGQSIVNAQVSALLTGSCGPNAHYVLTSASIKVYIGAKGTVREAIEAFQAGALTLAESPNVEGHWS